MQNLIKYILCLISVISFMTISHYASAQRTMHGQSSIHAEALFNGRSFGAEVSYGQYTLNGYWDTGISFNDYNENLSTGDRFQYGHLSVKGGYMFRIAGTTSRNISLYGGGGTFLGYELMDPFGRLPFIETNTNDFRFLYGIYAKINLEVFLIEKTALTLNLALPVNFSSVFEAVHYQTGLGCKILL